MLRRVTGKKNDIWTGKHKKSKKSEKDKKSSIKTGSPPKLPCKTVLRFKPQRGAYILDAAGSYIIGCSHTAASTLMRKLCTKLNSGEITWQGAAMIELHLQKQSGIDID